MNYSIIPNDQLRELCIKKNWFNCGTTSQYSKLFEGKRIYEALIRGDPKMRSLRALYQTVYTGYIDKAKREEVEKHG